MGGWYAGDLYAGALVIYEAYTSRHWLETQSAAGRVWARDGSYKPIDTVEYQHKVFHYILRQKNAWTWSYKQPFPEE